MPNLRPALRVTRRALPRVIEGIIGPSAMFLTGHALWGLGGGLVLAFIWTGACLTLRITQHRAASGLLIIAAISLILRTAIALIAHSSTAFFLGPDIVTACMGLIFIASAFTAKPLAARVAGDFVPPSMLDLTDPNAARLCRIASALWGTEQLITSGVTGILVFRFSPTQFVTFHEPISLAVFAIVMAIALPFFRTDIRAIRHTRANTPTAHVFAFPAPMSSPMPALPALALVA
jgi:hypothetical protein